VRALFREYADWTGVDLSFQGFARELAKLPGDYAPPAGVLFLCMHDEEPAGCVAVRRWQLDACEMKRLYAREAFRGRGYGTLLAGEAIAWARSAGYKRMLLDTLPSMTAAQRLYTALGFREIPPYRFNPIAGAKFMELVLADERAR
jgi:GNAT superfamily N-acetyltransferase